MNVIVRRLSTHSSESNLVANVRSVWWQWWVAFATALGGSSQQRARTTTKKPCPTIVITLPVGACLVSAFRCLGRFFHAAWIDATRWLSIILHTLFMSCLVVFGFSEHWIRHGSMDQDALSHITNANLMRLMYRNILSDIMRIGIILSIIKTF